MPQKDQKGEKIQFARTGPCSALASLQADRTSTRTTNQSPSKINNFDDGKWFYWKYDNVALAGRWNFWSEHIHNAGMPEKGFWWISVVIGDKINFNSVTALEGALKALTGITTTTNRRFSALWSSALTSTSFWLNEKLLTARLRGFLGTHSSFLKSFNIFSTFTEFHHVPRSKLR